MLFSRYHSARIPTISVSVSRLQYTGKNKMDNYNVNEAFLENLSLGLSSSLGKRNGERKRKKQRTKLYFYFPEKLPGVQDVR